MIGKTISHYEIIDKLGEGGMGVVYRARDTKLDRQVAIKLLPPHLSADKNAKQRFIHEAKAASSLDHPNICTIHEINQTDDGRLFIVMAYYEGESLRQRLDRGVPAFDEALDIAVQIAAGLAEAHRQGIVHRDIKPGNIFITRDGRIKIVDFGLAKLAGQTKITQTGSTLGTVSYMSPEQVQGGETDTRSDVFSLGVVLYELFAGELPFAGEHEAAVLYSIVNSDPKPLMEYDPSIPAVMQAIVNKALAKNREKRYQSAGAILTELGNLRERRKAASYTRGRAVPTRRLLKPARWMVPTAVLAILIGIFLLKPLLFEDSPVAAPKPIVVITFENLTGDDSYDYLQEAIPNLLISSLEQSKYLSVITWERLHDLLEQMGKADLKIIDKDTGFELCRMEGINTIVVGSFAKAGDIFATDVKVLDVDTKELIKSASATGEGVGSILQNQIDELSKDIARGAGLSERKIKQTAQPVSEMTTTSMEAYNYYLRGRREFEKFYKEEAKQFLERAVALDSTFAMAHLYLARIHEKLRDRRQELKEFELAMKYTEKASEKDRLYIEAAYADRVERDKEKQIRLLNRIVERYPQEKYAHMLLSRHYRDKGQFERAVQECRIGLDLDPNNAEIMNQLAYTYIEMEEYERAIEYFQRYAALSPGDANPFDSMAECYFAMGRLDDALAKYKEALSVKPDFHCEPKIAYIYGVRGQYDEAFEWINRHVENLTYPGMRAVALVMRSGYLLATGQRVSALADCEESVDLLSQVGNSWATAAPLFMSSFVYSSLEQYQESLERCRRAYEIGLPFAQNPAFWEALMHTAMTDIFLEMSQIDSIDVYLSELEQELLRARKDSPRDTQHLNRKAAELRVEVLLQEGKIEKALKACEDLPLMQIPYLNPAYFIFYNFPLKYDTVARVYVAAGRIEDAIVEYEKLVAFDPASKDRHLIDPRSHFRLARMYERSGRTRDALEHYRRFLELYKHADPGTEEVTDAERRVAALERES